VDRFRSRTESGASAVEFALVVPFLCLLLLGMVTTGFTYSDHLSITNSVREGARFGSSSVYTQAASVGPPAVAAITPAQWAASVQTRVHDVYFGTGSNASANDICVDLVKPDGTSAIGGAVGSPAAPLPTCAASKPTVPAGMAAGSCAVMVWTRKQAHITLVIAPTLNFNIGAASVSYYGRTAGVCTAS
jgi:Flp pilus assembly protein TadG